jgi:Zn-dependent peptidase ImmA (M78 family)
MIKIPKKFNVAGQTYTVVMDTGIQMEEDGILYDCHGLCQPQFNKITINKEAQLDRKHVTYLHELTHVILHEMGHELYHDETFISVFSGLLHQVFITSKGEHACV